MGLSLHTRIKGVYYSIHRLNKYKDSYLHSLKGSRCKAVRLVKLVDKLWYAFLADQKNDEHWFRGSSATNTVYINTHTPWGVSINHHCYNLMEQTESEVKDTSSCVNVFNYFLGIEHLLAVVDTTCEFVYKTYTESEQLAYYLRRHEDNALGYSLLNKILADIQGECFSKFIDEMDGHLYTRAYILNMLCRNYVYGSNYPYYKEGEDPILDWIVDCGLSNSLSYWMNKSEGSNYNTLKFLASKHKFFQEKGSKVTPFDRIMLVLDLCGTLLQGSYTLKCLMKVIEEHNLCTPDEYSLIKHKCVTKNEIHNDWKSIERENDSLSIYY